MRQIWLASGRTREDFLLTFDNYGSPQRDKREPFLGGSAGGSRRENSESHKIVQKGTSRKLLYNQTRRQQQIPLE
jgi:hypothetical protein